MRPDIVLGAPGFPYGAPVVPFYPFSFWLPLLKPNSRKKSTLIKGLPGNLESLHKVRPETLNPKPLNPKPQTPKP